MGEKTAQRFVLWLLTTDEALSRDLKQRGFNFCGPIISYAFAQAVGMVNDHVTGCFRHAECAKLGKH